MSIPFENYVQVYDLKGEHLLEAIEFSVSSAQTNPDSFYSGRMLQIGGEFKLLRNMYLVYFNKGTGLANGATDG